VTSTARQLFALGHLVWTPAARAVLLRHNVDPLELVQRHGRGDWGDLAAEDRLANRLALESGSFILSAYRVGSERVWVVTDENRASTWILLPSEY
jgi:hypothetical protein